MLELDPNRPASQAAAPRPSSTVLVLREHEHDLEIFCVIRHPRSSFLGGAVAFPGGKVDPADRDPRWESLTEMSEAWAERLGDDLPDSPRALGIAACREALEEAALLPVLDEPTGKPALATSDSISTSPSSTDAPLSASSTARAAAADPTHDSDVARALRHPLNDEAARVLRTALEAGASLLDELTSRKLFLDLAALRPFARWITPIAETRRYDATFFLMALPRDSRALPTRKRRPKGSGPPPHAFSRGGRRVSCRWHRRPSARSNCSRIAARSPKRSRWPIHSR